MGYGGSRDFNAVMMALTGRHLTPDEAILIKKHVDLLTWPPPQNGEWVTLGQGNNQSSLNSGQIPMQKLPESFGFTSSPYSI